MYIHVLCVQQSVLMYMYTWKFSSLALVSKFFISPVFFPVSCANDCMEHMVTGDLYGMGENLFHLYKECLPLVIMATPA